MMSMPEFKAKQIVIVFLNYGEKISFKNDNIVVHDDEGKIRHQSTCYRIFVLFVIGHLTITSGLLQRAKKFGFSIIFMTSSLRVYSSVFVKAEGNVLLRKKQYKYQQLDIARSIIANKIENQVTALKNIRLKNEEMKIDIKKMLGYKESLEQCEELDQMLGMEGLTAKLYFKNMFLDHGWEARRPRAKNDKINCLMDMGYTLLFNVIEALLCLYGFDVYYGVLHKQYYQRKSLVCDLVEPFRPLIDLRIRKALNLSQVDDRDFYVRQGQYFLNSKHSPKYVAILMELILERKEDIFLYIQSYYRSFMKDKPIDQYPVFRLK